MQRRVATGLVAVGLTALVALMGTGCEQRASSSDSGASGGSRTAVVDLNAVAKALGRDEAIQQQLQSATQQLNQQLVQAAQQMQEDLQKKQEELGEDASEEQLNELKQRFARAQRNVQVNKAKAELVQRKAKAKLVQQFREEVKPIAQRIAKEQGADVVVVANNEVLWFDPGSDITGEVIAEMRAAGHAGSSGSGSSSGGSSQSQQSQQSTGSASGSGGGSSASGGDAQSQDQSAGDQSGDGGGSQQ
jgi:Skp family chaperone for outer membrane proteins